MSEKPYTLTKVDSYPIGIHTASQAYIDIINDVLKQDPGMYKIDIPNKKTATIYIALKKFGNKHNELIIHKIANAVYIEKLKGKSK